MKNLILKSKMALMALSFLTFASCSSDDDSPQVEAPTISYTTTTIDAILFHDGSSGTPSVNWNGNVGSFSLTTSITGLSIDTTTGVLNWTNDLPFGTHNIEVLATNTAGQTTANLILNNPLQGVFTGTYNNTLFFEVEFNSDGSAIVRSGSGSTRVTSTGEWFLNGTNINVDYTTTGGTELSLSGTLAIGNTSAVYSGDWYRQHGAISANRAGVFEVTLSFLL